MKSGNAVLRDLGDLWPLARISHIRVWATNRTSAGAPGTVPEMRLDIFGIINLYVRVHVAISERL